MFGSRYRSKSWTLEKFSENRFLILVLIIGTASPFLLLMSSCCNYMSLPGWRVKDGNGFHLLLRQFWGFPGSPVVKTSPSTAGRMGLIPGWGTKMPHTMSRKQTTTTKIFNLSFHCHFSGVKMQICPGRKNDFVLIYGSFLPDARLLFCWLARLQKTGMIKGERVKTNLQDIPRCQKHGNDLC